MELTPPCLPHNGMIPSHIKPLPPAANAALSHAAVTTAQAQTPTAAHRSDRGLAEFNDLVGLKPRGHHNPVTLKQGLVQPRTARLQQRRTANASPLDAAADTDEHLHAASSDVLGALRSGGRSGLEERLSDSYDPLERHALLEYTRAKVDESDFSEAEKNRLKKDLDGMLAELDGKHGDEIGIGQKNKVAFESALGEMNALSAGSHAHDHAGSLTQLRALYGSRGNGKTEMGLTPMGLAKSLIDKFGAGNFIGALGGLRSKMASDFRNKPADRAGPRLWLSLTDAASFNVVQSSFALAGDLRRDLSERAKVVGKGTQAETAVALLGVTEQGRGRADPLLSQIADIKTLDEKQKMQLFALTRQAVEKMPMTAWPKDVPAQRMNLLDELRTLGVNVCDKMPRTATSAEQLEQKMRGVVQRKDQREDQSKDQSSDQREGGDTDRGRDESQVVHQRPAVATKAA